MNFFDNKKSFG